MPNLARVKFMPGDHSSKPDDYVNPREVVSNKCCMCGSPIKVESKKDDGECPNKDCTRDSFFKEAYRILGKVG